MARRTMLAALGAGGLTLTAAAGAGAAERSAVPAAGPTMRALLAFDFCLTTTVDQLRAETAPQANYLYYVADAGKEGVFKHDPADTTSADDTGLVLVSTNGKRFKRVFSRDEVRVTWFGATGDGSTDDHDRIQAAIDAVSQLGGGTVYFPAGTYIVSPKTNERRIRLRSKVNLRGEGDNSVLKVKDNAGDYWVILGGFWGEDIVRDVSISHLKIDQNVAANTSCFINGPATQPGRDATGDLWWRQFCIGLFNYDNIEVDHVTFAPTCGVNSVVINNYQCRNARISNCVFDFVKAKGDRNYDNSAIYVNGVAHTITGNRFRAAVEEMAFGAMETHGAQSVVSNNISDGYITGVNAQSSEYGGDIADMTITGNTFSNAAHGIQLWPRKDRPVRNVTIAGNTVSLANKTHNRSGMMGIGTFPGEFMPDTSPFENIVITGNTVLYQEEFEQREVLWEQYAFGIGLMRANDMTNVVIADNVIKNPPLTGIVIGNREKKGTSTNVAVTGNVITNPGHYPAKAERFRAGILVQSAVFGARITDNTIIDTYAQAKGLYAIRANEAEGSYAHVVIRDNLVRSKQGGLWLDLAPGIETDEVRERIAFTPSFPPQSGTFDAGDLLWVTGEVSGPAAPVGYRVLGSGTAGTLTGVTGTGTAGTAKLTVNDAAALRVGQVIVIATGNQVRRIVQIGGTTVRLDRNLDAAASASAVGFAAPRFAPFATVDA
ncbi:glycosyl hydrolase family 28-related protein [Jiangella alba]|nr:glycosyl hydrolase family 28-related protein [Jiangella alba]